MVGRWVGGSVGRWVGGSVGRWVGGSVGGVRPDTTLCPAAAALSLHSIFAIHHWFAFSLFKY